jgi:hypothetical protein
MLHLDVMAEKPQFAVTDEVVIDFRTGGVKLFVHYSFFNPVRDLILIDIFHQNK